MSTRFSPDEQAELERRLSDRLESMAPRPRLDAGERVRSAFAATRQRQGFRAWLAQASSPISWRLGAAIGVVALAAVMVGIGIGASGFGKSPAPSGAASFGATWQQVQLLPPETAATDLVEDGYAGPTRTVLVGEVGGAREAGGETTPAAWYSDDGITWHASVITIVSPRLVVHGLSVVYGVGDRLYAIGPANPGSGAGWSPGLVVVVFESTDGGATWIQLPDVNPPIVFSDVVADGHGLVAVSLDTAIVWTSTDDKSWVGHVTADPAGSNASGEGLHAVAAHAGKLVAVGQSWTSDNVISGIVMTSPDGMNWTRDMAPEGFAPQDVTWADGAWLMAGYRGGQGGTPPRATILRSTDGLTWSPVELPAPEGAGAGSGIVSIAAGADGIVAIGGGDGVTGTFSAWTSTDGTTWRLHPLTNGPIGYATGVTALVRPGQIIVAGNGYNTNRDRLPAVWDSTASAVPSVSLWANGELASISPAPTPNPVAASPIFADWSRVDLPDPAPDEYGGTISTGVVRFQERWVAIGFVNGGCCDGGYSTRTRGVVWTSMDGDQWTLVPPQDALAEARIYSVATNGDRIVAVGAVDGKSGNGEAVHTPATWYSSDGVSWHLAVNPPSLNLITVAGGEFVAVSDAGQMAGFYTSADGRGWTYAQSGGPGNASADTVVRVMGLSGAVDGSVTAVGFIGTKSSGGDWVDSATVWSSPGLDIGLTLSSLGDGAMACGIVSIDGVWLVTGLSTDGTKVLAWSTRDGASWSQPTLVQAGGDGAGLSPTAVVVAGTDVIVAGTGTGAGDTGTIRVWVRTNGTWYGVSGATGPDGEVSALAYDSERGRVLGLGTGGQGSSHPTPFVWIAQR